MHKRFDHTEIEKKWQARWKEEHIYKATEDTTKPKSYVLDMFPYPSGEGLHVGHPKGYIATDIYSRYKRMTGHQVLHPMGWDAFGLPAENYALKNKIHPRSAVDRNVQRFKSQLELLGFDYDWDREINTTDPEYYRWTQWIFTQLYKKGLAYESYEPINWCPSCQTGLANEDLESDGTCERCGSTVEQKPMRQWVLKIREYADRMLEDLNDLNWAEHIKELQRNWIGRSEGAEIDFELSVGEKVTVFTTRPDTLFGVTYLVLAPEHVLIEKHKHSIRNWPEVSAYVTEAKNKKEMDRLNDSKEKTGVQLDGLTAINPANNEIIPVYIADYVLASYGTGAIMAVPAHDERDFQFAKKFNLKVRQVIGRIFNKFDQVEVHRRGVYGIVTNEKGEYLLQHFKNKGFYWLPGGGMEDNETEEECLRRELAEESGFTSFTNVTKVTTVFYDHNSRKDGRSARNETIIYKLSVDSTEQNAISLTAAEIDDGLKLIWVHPNELDKILQDGELSRSELVKYVINLSTDSAEADHGALVNSGEFNGMTSEEAKQTITEKVGGRMTKTYKLRDWVFSRQRYWGEPIPIIHCEKCGAVPVPESELPVKLPDVEHYEPTGDGRSPLANITSWVNTTCPTCSGSAKRETNTMPQWAGSSWYYLRYMDPKNSSALVSATCERYWAPVDVYVGGAEHATRHLIYARFWHKFLYDIGVVSTKEPFQKLYSVGLVMAEDGRKMSKRWGNVINPDDVVAHVGADTLRIYEMFMGPFENAIAWSKDGVVGARRFLERVHGLSEHITDIESEDTRMLLHKTIKKVGEDIIAFKFNTAISSMMILLNALEKTGLSKQSYLTFLRLLAPFAPHLTEELWVSAGNSSSIHTSEFPTFEEALIRDDVVTIGVQINGKVRGQITITSDATEQEALSAIEKNEQLQSKLVMIKLIKVIYVPGKIVNLVVAE